MTLFISDSIFSSTEKKGVDFDKAFAGYIVVEDGLIQKVGKGEAPESLKGQAEKIIDARGKTITAGLVDAHTHLVHGGSR